MESDQLSNKCFEIIENNLANHEVIYSRLYDHFKTTVYQKNDENGINYAISSIYINYGTINNKSDFVFRGVEFAKKVLGKTKSKKLIFELEYNIANAYSALEKSANIWSNEESYKNFPSNRYRDEIKGRLQRITYKNQEVRVTNKALVNLAIALSYTGRFLEAVQLLDGCISRDKNDGMAVSTKLSILHRYGFDLYKSGFADGKILHRGGIGMDTLRYVYHEMQKLRANEKCVKQILEIGFPKVLDYQEQIMSHIKANISISFLNSDEEIERLNAEGNFGNYADFLAQNELFLSYNCFDYYDGFSQTNDLTIGLITPMHGFDDHLFLSILNEIKESYSWCSFTLYNYKTKKNQLVNEVDEEAGYLDNPLRMGHNNGIRIKELKLIIRESYDIFDKIMTALAIYHNQKHKNIKWNSFEFWTEKRRFKDFIVKQKSLYLTALYDLRSDMTGDNGIYKWITNVREKVTHSTYTVKEVMSVKEEIYLTTKELETAALESLKVAKAGILYMAMHFNMDYH